MRMRWSRHLLVLAGNSKAPPNDTMPIRRLLSHPKTNVHTSALGIESSCCSYLLPQMSMGHSYKVSGCGCVLNRRQSYPMLEALSQRQSVLLSSNLALGYSLSQITLQPYTSRQQIHAIRTRRQPHLDNP
jgi:hypothetical protein